MDEELREEARYAYGVLNDMMHSFDEWYPFDEACDESDRKDIKEGFARTKLNLELGEYTRDDYEYLQWLIGKTAGHEQYYDAVDTFIRVLSLEYGWI